MGVYVYRVTAERVKTPVGEANVAKFAYKNRWDLPANIMVRSGCVGSVRMFANGNATDLIASVGDDGTIYAVYRNCNMVPLFHDTFYGKEGVLPVLYTKQNGIISQKEPV